MSVVRVGSNEQFANNWDKIFGGGKSGSKSTKKKAATKKTAKAKTTKAAKKKTKKAKK